MKKLQTALEQLREKAPKTGDKGLCERLALSKSQLVVRNGTRAEKSANDTINARKRFDTDQAALAEFVAEGQRRIAKGAADFAAADLAWQANEVAILKQEEDALAIIDEKIAAAVRAGGVAAPGPGKAVVSTGGAAAPVLPGGAEDTAKAFAKLAVAVVIMPDTLADMAKAPVPQGDSEAQLARMYHWAMASSMGDSRFPFRFREMGATVEAAFDLVGRTVWEQFFGKVVITAEEICPMQLRQLVFRQLMYFSTLLSAKKHNAMQEEEEKRLADNCAQFLKHREQLEAHNAHW